MKKIGKPPLRDMKNDKLLKEIYAQRCDKQMKYDIPDTVMRDQLVGMPPVDDIPGPLDCAKCGEEFAIGKRFVLNNKTGEIWCEDCFREYAMNVTKYEFAEGDSNV